VTTTAAPVANTKFMARISPKRPKGSPARLTLPWLEGTGRRFYDADLGFVPVEPVVAEMLKKVHADGEVTERGGQGPMLFEVVTADVATKILQVEQKRVLLAATQGNAAVKNGEWTDEDLENVGVTRPNVSALDALKATQAALASGAQHSTTEAPADGQSQGPATSAPTGRVGRRPPRGKASLPGAGA